MKKLLVSLLAVAVVGFGVAAQAGTLSNALNNAANNAGGNVYITNDDGTFIFETPNSGWALVGSNIQIHVKEGEREFIGGFVDDNFLLKDNWVYDEELGEYIYSIENINKVFSI